MTLITGRLVGSSGPTALPVPSAGQVVQSVVALRALAGSVDIPGAILQQYGPDAYIGGGEFTWSAAAATDDGVTRFNAGGEESSGSGWQRNDVTFIAAEWAGFSPTASAAANVTALQRALDAAATLGLPVTLPPGAFDLDSASLPVTLSTGAVVRGAGQENTVLTITGAGAANLFTATDVQGIRLERFQAVGNSAALSDGDGKVLAVTGTTATVLRGFTVEDCTFDNFGGDYWIDVYQSHTGGNIENVRVQDNVFLSRSGNCRVPTLLTSTSVCFVAHGAPGGTGLVRDVRISDNYAECTFIKGFAWVYNNVEDVAFADNVILNAGADGGISDDVGCYALMAYNSTPSYADPLRVRCEGNHIVAPRSCGIYAAGAADVRITGNYISGQTDAEGSTLPKGAVALNGVTSALIEGNELRDNRFGVWAATAPDVDSHTRIANNTIVSDSDNVSPSGAAGVIVAPYTGAALVGDVEIVANIIHNTGTDARAVFVRCTAAEALRSVRVLNNDLRATYSCVNVYAAGGSPNIAFIDVVGNALYSTGASAVLIPGAVDSAITVCNNDFRGGWDASSAHVLDVNGSHGLDVRENLLREFSTGTGAMLSTTGAQGVIRDNRFLNVADARRYVDLGPEVLGVDVPTWTPPAGSTAWVDNIDSTTTALLGWRWNGAGWEAASFSGMLAPGSVSIASDQWHIQYRRLQMTGTQRLTLAGTARYILTDL